MAEKEESWVKLAKELGRVVEPMGGVVTVLWGDAAETAKKPGGYVNWEARYLRLLKSIGDLHDVTGPALSEELEAKAGDAENTAITAEVELADVKYKLDMMKKHIACGLEVANGGADND